MRLSLLKALIAEIDKVKSVDDPDVTFWIPSGEARFAGSRHLIDYDIVDDGTPMSQNVVCCKGPGYAMGDISIRVKALKR